MSQKPLKVEISKMLMPEILRYVSGGLHNNNKAERLKSFKNSIHNPALTTLLILIYDWSLEFRLPEGEPPYNPNPSPENTNHLILTNEYKSLYNFVVGGNDSVSQAKIEHIYIQLLEGLHPSESELLIRVFNKKCLVDYNKDKSYKIPFEVVKDVYPEIVWFNRGKGSPNVKLYPHSVDMLNELKDDE